MAPPDLQDLQTPRFRSRAARGLLWTVLAVDLLVAGAAWRAVVSARDEEYAQARVNARNLALALGESLDGKLNQIDVALLAVKEELERQRASGGVRDSDLEAYVARFQARLPFLDAIRITDAAGLIVHGIGVPPGSRVGIGDREYFQRARADPSAGMVVSTPLVGRFSGKWSIAFARRTNGADGAFAGIVYGLLSLDAFTRTLAGIDVGTQGAVVVRGADLGLVARYPERGGLAKAFGEKNVSPQMKAAVDAGRREATFVARSPFDAAERAIGYRSVADGTFHLLVALSADEFLAGWRQGTARTLGSTAIFVLLTVLAAWLVVRSMRAEAEARFRDLIEEAPIAVAVTRGTRLVYVNGEFFRTLRLPPAAAAIGRSLVDSLRPEDVARVTERMERRMRGQPVEPTIEFALRRPDGSEFRAVVTDASVDLGNGPAVLGFIQDVTEQRRAEADRERLIHELQAALAEVKTLSGLLPICAHCKKIRDDKGYWNKIETFIRERSGAEFTHGICPDCALKYYDDDGSPGDDP